LFVIAVVALNNHFAFTQNVTWKAIQPPLGKQMDAWCIDKLANVVILCDSIFYFSSDAGENWISSGKKADTSRIMSIAVSSQGDIYYVTGSSYRYRSRDSAKSWASYAPIGYYGPYVGSYFKGVDLTRNGYLLLSQGDNLNNAWLTVSSVDTLFQWSPLYFWGDGFARIVLSYSSDDKRTYVGQAKVDQWVAGGHHNIYDGGIWSIGSNSYGFYQHDVNSLFVDYSGGACAVVDSNQVYYTSSIESKSWLQRPNPPSAKKFSILSNQRGDIFLSTAQSLYQSRIVSPAWQLCSSGLPSDSITDMKISETGYLFVRLAKGQFYRSETPTTEVPESPVISPKQFALFQNYPNPFNPQTEIEFEIDKASFVSLRIYDILSREITTLVAQHLEPGHYTQTWDGSSHSSGVYFYTLQSGNSKQTKKLILQK
jgi:hypothetical protein